MTRALAIAVMLGCGTSPPTPDAMVGPCPDPPAAPTFTNVQQLFTDSCTSCHAPGVPLDLTRGSYARIVGVAAQDYTNPVAADSCGGMLVVPGNPDASYLYVKLTSATPCAGTQMPETELAGPAPLAACFTTMVHDWIAAGAPND